MAQRRVMNVADVVPFSLPGWEGKFESRLLVDRDALGSEKLTVNHFTLKVGQKTPLGSHGAPYDEVYYVLRGRAILTIADPDATQYDVGPGTVACIPAECNHQIETVGTEDLEIITIMPGNPEPGINAVYDQRREKWGTSLRLVNE